MTILRHMTNESICFLRAAWHFCKWILPRISLRLVHNSISLSHYGASAKALLEHVQVLVSLLHGTISLGNSRDAEFYEWPPSTLVPADIIKTSHVCLLGI